MQQFLICWHLHTEVEGERSGSLELIAKPRSLRKPVRLKIPSGSTSCRPCSQTWGCSKDTRLENCCSVMSNWIDADRTEQTKYCYWSCSIFLPPAGSWLEAVSWTRWWFPNKLQWPTWVSRRMVKMWSPVVTADVKVNTHCGLMPFPIYFYPSGPGSIQPHPIVQDEGVELKGEGKTPLQIKVFQDLAT